MEAPIHSDNFDVVDKSIATLDSLIKKYIFNKCFKHHNSLCGSIELKK